MLAAGCPRQEGRQGAAHHGHSKGLRQHHLGSSVASASLGQRRAASWVLSQRPLPRSGLSLPHCSGQTGVRPEAGAAVGEVCGPQARRLTSRWGLSQVTVALRSSLARLGHHQGHRHWLMGPGRAGHTTPFTRSPEPGRNVGASGAGPGLAVCRIDPGEMQKGCHVGAFSSAPGRSTRTALGPGRWRLLQVSLPSLNSHVGAGSASNPGQPLRPRPPTGITPLLSPGGRCGGFRLGHGTV